MLGFSSKKYSGSTRQRMKSQPQLRNDEYIMMNYILLLLFILFYFILFYFILFYFILFYFILFYFILFYFILFYFIYYYIIFIESECSQGNTNDCKYKFLKIIVAI